MNLLSRTREVACWVTAVMRAFFSVRAWTTLALVLSMMFNRFAVLLAFFLPLKVILLAGSDGVPRYFRFFIEPDQKMPWIIGLSIGAVAFYLISLILDVMARRLAEAGSFEVLQGANEIAVTSRHREEAQTYYARFSDVVAGLLVVLIAFSVLGLINPLLFGGLLVLTAVQYIFTASVIWASDPHSPGALARTIRDSLPTYLNVLASVNFLIGFLIILAPYLMELDRNLILSILSILLLRQSLNAISSITKVTVNLWKQRPKIDPMVFRERQLQSREQSIKRALRAVFEVARRRDVARMRIEAAGRGSDGLVSHWQDSRLKGLYTFHLKANRKEGGKYHYQQQVFPRNQRHLLEHEEYLFSHVDRATLKAPELVARFDDGPFACQILEYGEGHGPSSQEWVPAGIDFMTAHWCFKPPRALIEAYATSQPTLHGRLTPEFLRRMSPALDHDRDVERFSLLLEQIEIVRGVLRQMPVYIFNPDLLRKNIVRNDDGRYVCMSWGRWGIEPIGASLLRSCTQKRLARILPEVREVRRIHEDDLTIDHVHLARECRLLERECMRGKYRGALEHMRKILANPLLGNGSR